MATLAVVALAVAMMVDDATLPIESKYADPARVVATWCAVFGAGLTLVVLKNLPGVVGGSPTGPLWLIGIGASLLATYVAGDVGSRIGSEAVTWRLPVALVGVGCYLIGLVSLVSREMRGAR